MCRGPAQRSSFSVAVDQLGLRRSLLVPKARVRAAQRGPTIFQGSEALAEVAREDGVWNWALVGPDSEELPLVAGGLGGIDEMRGALDKHSHSFGLVRLTFGTGAEARTWFLFIHASCEMDSGRHSAKERAQGLKAPDMQRALRRFCGISATVHVHSKEECTSELLVAELRRAVQGGDSETISAESYDAGLAAQKELHPEQCLPEKERDDLNKMLEKIEAPLGQEAEPEVERVASEGSRPRRAFKPFRVGTPVEVFSANEKLWVDDGEVTAVARESFHAKSQRVSAGSTKVVYSNGKKFKWIPAHKLVDFVRASSRPRAPKPAVGMLSLEVYQWWGASYENRYFELHRGFLQWWTDKAEAKSGAQPYGSMYLLGLQQEASGLCVKVRSDSTERAIYTIRVGSEEEQFAWMEAFWYHAEFCEEECEYYQALEDEESVTDSIGVASIVSRDVSLREASPVARHHSESSGPALSREPSQSSAVSRLPSGSVMSRRSVRQEDDDTSPAHNSVASTLSVPSTAEARSSSRRRASTLAKHQHLKRPSLAKQGGLLEF